MDQIDAEQRQKHLVHKKVRNLVSEPVFKTVFLTVNFQVIVIEKFGIPVKRYNNLEDTWSMR